MNAGATAERVLEALRWQIMNREFRPGDRLDPAQLAIALASSVTPVRDALHLLAGEELVETRMGSGFHMPALDEPGLEDLYDWSAQLLALAIRCWPQGLEVDETGASDDMSALATMVANMFALVARRSTNSEHGRAIGRLNARLHAVRCVEPRVLENTKVEFDELRDAVTAAKRAAARRLIAAYHRRRRRAAAEIVRAVHRAD